MNMTEKNGQPSMEEILASIRRIIAEEPSGQAHGDFRGGQPIMLKGDGVLDDAGDFDLPAIFRSSATTPASERPAPLLGRLTDAIRSATTTTSHAEETANTDEAAVHEANGAASEPIQDYSLSSLQPVRPNGQSVVETGALQGGAAPMNGSAGLNGHGLNGHGHDSKSSHPAPASLSAASSDSGGEPKRVMAPFKDTKFMGMSGPAASSPASAAAPVEIPAAPEPEAPPPPAFEAQSPSYAEPIATPETEIHPQVVNMPPPPLPAAAAVPGEGPEGVGSIEDTTADLLRPMLRQWLADNMPRMVEKALHIEIAESVKPVKKP